MTNYARLIRATIAASDQRQKAKFAGGGDVDPMTGLQIGGDSADEPSPDAGTVLGRAAGYGRDVLSDVNAVAKRFTNYDRQLTEDVLNLPRRIYQNPKKASDIGQRLLGGENWIANTAKSGATLPHDVMTGEVPTHVVDPVSGEMVMNPEMIQRAQDLAGMAGGQTLMTGAREAAIKKGATNVGAAKAPVDVGRGLEGTPGGGEGLREAQLQAQRRAGSRQPLEGLPEGAQVVEGQPFIPGPYATAHDVAESYMAGKDYGVPHPDRYHPLDVEHARAIAKAFDEMPHAPKDPEVKAAYEALAKETLDQYRAIKESGLKITPVNAADYPYHGNPRAVAKDVADNNHMAFFKTNEGFGTNFHADPDHPMLRSSGEKVGDHDMLYNDLFRVVHDYFGHVKNGFGFRAAGEDNAWRAHAPMYSPLARRAMTTETRGQNSWLNHGPHGEFNRTANAADTIYSDQKVGLMPEWTMADRAKLLSDSAGPGAPLAALEHAPKFFSGAERAVEAAPQAKMTGAEWLGALANKGGVKAEEMKWTGLGDYLLGKKDAPVTKAELQEHLGANKVELGEVTKGGGDVEALARKLAEEENGPGSWDRIGGGGQEHYWRDARRDLGTKFQDYQLPGGENYSEKLLTLPFRRDANGDIIGHEIGGQNYRSSHWDNPNVLVHRRSNERDVDGKKALHLEEIQSDWHQAGRKKGYGSRLKPGWRIVELETPGEFSLYGPQDARYPIATGERAAVMGAAKRFGGMTDGVPDAPFKKNWHELALKDAIREAAEKGLDRISWTPGEAQAARYDLSKHIERVYYDPDVGTVSFDAKPGQTHPQSQYKVPPEKLPDIVGKDVAEKLLQSPRDKHGIHSLGGLDLKIGGEGMKGFYDKIVPDYLNKVGKPHGVKVEKGKVTADAERPLADRDVVEVRQRGDEWHVINTEDGSLEQKFPTRAGAMEHAEEINKTARQGHAVHYMEIPQSLKDQALKKGFSLFEDSAAAGAPLAALEKSSGVHYAPPKREPQYYEHELNTAGNPIINKGVENPPNPKVQTVADPYRMMFPGIYGNPREIAAKAAARVGAEDPSMKQLFGVTRGDLREMAQGRVGNEEPALSLAKNPRGSVSAQNIQTPQNTQRLTDILGEAGKHEGLRTADAWYIMDPVYNRMKEMGSNDPAAQYKRFNTMTAMASPGSDVMTEIQRGTAAHWLANSGRFEDFQKYAGVPEFMRSRMKFPSDMRYIEGHPYHRTSQGDPMAKYLEHGEIKTDAAKVPLYAHASGVPETGFQTKGPVGDAHFSRGVGLADTRRGPTDVGSSFSKPEYQTLQPWWQHDVAGKVGLESVPAQARLWTTLGPQTGVDSALGAPKLELLTKQIMETARRLRISPEKARDLVLSGKAGAGQRGGRVSALAEGGAVGDDYNTPVDEAAFQTWKALNAPNDSGVDYDLRGAYLADMQRAENGHMGDRFKKPNHPTFSDQSQYATGDQRARAGNWVGETFVPPAPFAEGGEVDETPTFDPTKFAAVKAAAPPVFDPKRFAAAKKPESMSGSDVLSGVIENAPSSAWQFAKDVVRPVTHPIETMTGIKDLALGLAAKGHQAGILPEVPQFGFGSPANDERAKSADAMGQYLKDRYGGLENIKKTVARDPVGALSDASMIFTGGGSMAARAPGILGRTGEIASNVGRAIDPILAPVNAAKAGTKAVGELLTHTGATPLENAYKAGVEGGEAGETFRSHMRGQADMTEPVAMAKQGLEGFRAERAKNYTEGMGDITSIDRQMNPADRVLDFGKIDDAVTNARKVQTFGTRVLDKGANEVRNAMISEINEWKKLPPATYHTIEGLDALKRSLGHMMMDTTAGTSSRKAASDIYNAVRKTIVDYDPKYARVMKDYELASGQIRELERAMSLGEKASADTALRKLQSIMRNNVNTNYGRRLELGQLLQEHGATHLMAALSGQALNAWAPRGLGKLGAEAALLGTAGHFISPWTLAAAPLMSPRLMGETAHLAGRTVGRGLNASNRALRGVGGNRTVGNVGYRLGRATNPYENAEEPANPYAK